MLCLPPTPTFRPTARPPVRPPARPSARPPVRPFLAAESRYALLWAASVAARPPDRLTA
ncbi:MAG: hypothetical protein ABIQ41_03515 [Gemmatimonadales bacterium]